MNIKFNKLVIAGSAAVMSLFLTTTASAEKYANDGGKNVVIDGSGDCVVASSGKEFGDCMEAQPIEKPMEAAPISRPPPPPKPKPVVIPKPKPQPKPVFVTKTLNLNEGGGANFEFGKSVLTASAKQRLASFATSVKSSNISPSAVSIVGHTDSVGSDKYNQKLSNERANSVANYLTGLGMPRNVMQVSGRGETQPVADNKTKAGRAQNRRVDIRVTGQRRIQVRQ